MSYVRLSDDLLDRLEESGLTRDEILVYVEGFSLCSRLLTDGHIRMRLSKFSSSPDPEVAAARLVSTGWWEVRDDGYYVPEYLKDNRPREEVERSKADARLKVERARKHKIGDHSLCLKGWYCPDGTIEPKRVTGNRPRNTPGKETSATPRTSPPRTEGESGGEEGGDETAAPGRGDSTPDKEEPPRLKLDVHAFGPGCCALPERNRVHQVAS